MRMSLADLAAAKKKREASERRPPQRQPVAKKPRVALGAPSASIRAAPAPPTKPPRADDDDVEILQPPFDAVPISARPPPRPSAPAEAARKGKAPADSSEGGEYFRVNAEVPMGASALKNKDRAEELLRAIFLPRDMELREGRTLEELTKSFYPGLLKMALDVSLIQAGFERCGSLCRAMREKNEALTADLEVSEERRLAAEARAADIAKEKKELASERDVLLGTVRSLKESFGGSEEKLKAEREWSAAIELKFTAAESRAEAAERESEALRQDLATACQGAVDEYKKSSDFVAEVAEGCLDSFHLGFVRCKEEAAKVFPGLDVDKIVEPEDLGEDQAEEADAEEPPARPPTPSDAQHEEAADSAAEVAVAAAEEVAPAPEG